MLAHVAQNYPSLTQPIEQRIRAVVERIGRWPQSAREVEERSGVRVVPLLRYPYRLFYLVKGETVEILHLHHAARDE